MSGIVGQNLGRGSGLVKSGAIVADSVSGSEIADNAIDSEHYTDGSIDNAHIADDAIDSEHYADGSIDNAHIADDAIDSEHYADGSIDNAHIADDAIDSEHYADGSIDNAHIADDAIDSEHYAAASIDNAHLADNAVDTAEIADNAVSLAKMAGGTDGNIISFDTSGNPVAVATGSDGQVLTSSGAGAVCAFEDASGGATTMDGLTDVKMDGTNFTNSLVIQCDSNGSAPTLGTFGSDCANNVGIGTDTFASMTDGINNTGIGSTTLDALNTGDYNSCLGAEAGSAISSGGLNTCLGWKTGNSISTGAFNIMIGTETGSYNVFLSTGSYNYLIGNYTYTSAVDVDKEIVIGYFIQGKGTNTTFIGGTAGAYNQENNASWTTTSDSRIKKNIVDSTKGVDAINQVQVRNFNYRPDSEIEIASFKQAEPPSEDSTAHLRNRPEIPENTYNTTRLVTGVIAQEFQTCFPESVKTGVDGILAVSKDEIVWALVKSVQELSADVEALKAG